MCSSGCARVRASICLFVLRCVCVCARPVVLLPRCPPPQSVQYMLSFGCGVGLATVALFTGITAREWLRGRAGHALGARPAGGPWHLRVAFVPGFASGALWNLGALCLWVLGRGVVSALRSPRPACAIRGRQAQAPRVFACPHLPTPTPTLTPTPLQPRCGESGFPIFPPTTTTHLTTLPSPVTGSRV
jgi:hypothetical protein